MSLNQHYTIETPENIAFRYEVAGIGSRFLATLLDTLILILLWLGVWLVILPVAALVEDESTTSIVLAIGILLSFAFFWGYYIFFELTWNGQSPGKRAIKLRVVRSGGRPVTFAASAIRNLVRIIDFLPGLYGLGVIVMFLDPRSRRLGDLAGGTLVVREPQTVTLDNLTRRRSAAPGGPARSTTAAPVELLPNVQTLSEAEYSVIQEFLRRRSDLTRQSRESLGRQLATGVYRRLGSVPEGSTPEGFLERVARDYRRYQAQAEAPANPPYTAETRPLSSTPNS